MEVGDAERQRGRTALSRRREGWLGSEGAARHRTGLEAARRPAGLPVFERVVTGEAETFLWRCDDYPWERNVWNIHPEIEIHLVRHVSGVALVGDHIGAFEPGHLAIVGGGLPHDWVTPTRPGEIIQGRDIVVQFLPDRLRAAAALLPEMAEVDRLLTESARGLAFHGDTRRRAADLMEAMGTAEGLDRLALFLRLLKTLASGGERQFLSSDGFTPSTDHRALDAAAAASAYIVENFRRDIRLGDLAAHLGMSPWACSRFLKKTCGNSFTDMLAQLRIGQACKLLSEGDLPVTDICFDIGYGNVSNFNRVFRLQRGLTPSAYRRLARKRRRTPAAGEVPG